MRYIATYLGCSGILYGIIHTMRLFYIWPNIGVLECLVLVGACWLVIEGRELAVGRG